MEQAVRSNMAGRRTPTRGVWLPRSRQQNSANSPPVAPLSLSIRLRIAQWNSQRSSRPLCYPPAEYASRARRTIASHSIVQALPGPLGAHEAIPLPGRSLWGYELRSQSLLRTRRCPAMVALGPRLAAPGGMNQALPRGTSSVSSICPRNRIEPTLPESRMFKQRVRLSCFPCRVY